MQKFVEMTIVTCLQVYVNFKIQQILKYIEYSLYNVVWYRLLDYKLLLHKYLNLPNKRPIHLTLIQSLYEKENILKDS